MSVTILQSPALYTPVYNPMRFVLSSTNTAQSNFKYVADVYISGVTGYTRLIYDTDPVSGQCAPDISRVIESYISKDFDQTGFNFQRCTNSIKAYEVKFGEQYGVSSGIVTYPNLTFSGLKYAWNGVIDPFTFINYNYTTYTCGGGSAMLTNRPATLYYNSASDHADLYFINDTSGCAYYAQINLYDSSNNQLSRIRIENTYQASSSYLDKMLKVAIGQKDIQNPSTIYTLVSGSALLFSNPLYHHYDVTMITYAGTYTSQTYTYYTECTSLGGSPIRLHWLNRLGGFDRFSFQLNRTKKSSIKKDTYQKNLGSLSNSAWAYIDQNAGDTVYNTEITDSYVINSNWINDSQSIWLQELVESPVVYFNTGSSFIPVIIKNTTYEVKTVANEKLFNLSLEFTYANKRWTQRA